MTSRQSCCVSRQFQTRSMTPHWAGSARRTHQPNKDEINYGDGAADRVNDARMQLSIGAYHYEAVNGNFAIVGTRVVRSAWFEKSEIATLVGAEHFLLIKPGVTARGNFDRRFDDRRALFEFRIVDQQIDAAIFDR